jgi:hypothetical protein
MEEHILIPLLEKHSSMKTKEELLEIYLRLFQKFKGVPEKPVERVRLEKGGSVSGVLRDLKDEETETELAKTVVLETSQSDAKPAGDTGETPPDEDYLAKTVVLERSEETETKVASEQEPEDDEFAKTLTLDVKTLENIVTKTQEPASEQPPEPVAESTAGTELAQNEQKEFEAVEAESEESELDASQEGEDARDSESEDQPAESRTGRPRPGKKKKRKKRGLEALK